MSNVRLNLFLVLFILFSSFYCSTSKFTWKRSIRPDPELPLVFDKRNVLGSGLKNADTGYFTKTCMSGFKSNISGGVLDIEFQKVDDSYKGNNLPVDHFIWESMERTRKYNPRDVKPQSFILIITVSNRIASIIEDSIELRNDVKTMIEKKDKERFFSTCGTEFIHSVVFNSEIYLFVSYYPESQEESNLIEEKIKRRITSRKNDIMQINIFNDLDFAMDTFFSLQVSTGTLFEPVEFPFTEFHGKKVDAFLNKLLYSVINSGQGRVKKFYQCPWLCLEQTRGLVSKRDSVNDVRNSEESVFKSLHLLESSIRQFNVRRKQVELLAKRNPDQVVLDCNRLIEELSGSMDWKNYYKCRDESEIKNTVDLEALPECRVITDAIRRLNSGVDCFKLQRSDIQGTGFIKDTTYLPVELVDRVVDDPLLIHLKETDYRFSDKYQLKDIPGEVKFGQGMDNNAVLYSDNCILKNTMHYHNDDKSIVNISNDYYPHSFREWSKLKKIVFFWKDSPKRILYRGSFEIEGYSKKLLPDFEISEEAKKIAMTGISKFYNKYGTHYVSQIMHRRGFVYYFSFGSPDDKDIEVIPFGMADPMTENVSEEMLSGIQSMGKSGCCLFPKLFSLFDFKDNTPGILKPKTVKEFFMNKEKIVQLFKDDRSAVPVRIGLEPWSEYLLNKGILKPHQLDLN